MSKNNDKVELLLRVIGKNLSDIALFQERLRQICDEVHPTGHKHSEFEDSWRSYFIIVLKRRRKANE